MRPSKRSFHVRPPLPLLNSLAIRDLWHDRKVSLCIIASLVAVIAPLLLLFGLRYGVVSQLNAELLNDPHNLEVRMSGNHNLPLEWFEQLRNQPGVGFVMPLTRSLNTQADLVRDSRHFIANVELIPSAQNDPLLSGHAPPEGQHVLLSASAASQLQVQVGETLSLVVLRNHEGNYQRGQYHVTVGAILSASAFTRPAVWLPLDVLVMLEDFRDGFAAPLLGFVEGTPAPPRQRYARARIYAQGLDDVGTIARWLEQQHIPSTTRVREIESVKAITRVLDLIFAVIAWTALAGCMASLAGALLANIDRKRKDLSLLRLLGFGQGAIGSYLILQALGLSSAAFALSCVLYALGSAVFNNALGGHLADSGFVCRLELIHILLAFSGTLLLAMGVAAIGGLRAIQIQPAESLRQS